jgi:hypothetical protein
MSSIPALAGGRFLSPPMSIGTTTVAVTDFSGSSSDDALTATTNCILKMNPTSIDGQVQVTGAILLVSANAANNDLIMPPVSQCSGMVLYIVNKAANEIDVKFVNSSGSIAELVEGTNQVGSNEVATMLCDGTDWYCSVGTLA